MESDRCVVIKPQVLASMVNSLNLIVILAMSDSLQVEKRANVYTPFSLQHWCVSSAVKASVKACGYPNYQEPEYLLDNQLFPKLKELHRRGVRVLDYEFSVNVSALGNGCRYRVPLRTLIHRWERRSPDVGMYILPDYCVRTLKHIDSLIPFCGCLISCEESANILTEENADRESAHAPRCKGIGYPGCRCRVDILRGISTRLNKNRKIPIRAHTSRCLKKEFRYDDIL